MTEQPASTARMRAVTISRQYGSGGGEIARRLAQRLQWRLFDHEAVVRVAEEMGISQEEAEARDENAPDFWTRVLQSLQLMQPPVGVSIPDSELNSNIRTYLDALQRVVNTAYQEGHVVIVGRESQILLADRRDVLHVRVVASEELRIRYVMQREGLSHDDAQKRLSEKDGSRNRLLKTEYQESPDNPLLYDMVVNTNVLSLDRAVDLIMLGLEAKADQLAVDAQQLGPGAGMPRYPGQEQDFPIPSNK
ncbi:MAG TPA: cytidylate kinase-like family protein [Ktedonobacter sp.]|nr:cytidylate kinase-like family protein [Ktedonobacter sp.]